ncbi:MAG TPA: PfkB family carbohydrate kinase [Arsenophonus sp.]
MWLAKPVECKIISTVGANDLMVAGLICGLLMNQSYEETFRLATSYFSSNVKVQ